MWDSKQQLPKQFTAWMVSSDIVLSTEWYSASIYEARTAAHKHYPQIKLMRLPRSTPLKKKKKKHSRTMEFMILVSRFNKSLGFIQS